VGRPTSDAVFHQRRPNPPAVRAHTEGGGFFTWYATSGPCPWSLALAKANTQYVNNVATTTSTPIVRDTAVLTGTTSSTLFHCRPVHEQRGRRFLSDERRQPSYASGIFSTAIPTAHSTARTQVAGRTTKASKANSTDTASLPPPARQPAYADVLATLAPAAAPRSSRFSVSPM